MTTFALSEPYILEYTASALIISVAHMLEPAMFNIIRNRAVCLVKRASSAH